ncbi:MAG: DegT/DnrJ/EryC1/StrS family aminotransferase [candidate division WS1 bacterium]|jgi:dTDP-4-amino-4,6-dideoxygalactose transaminase|nr:DegT/DnrJ/EryC1/StrS family aminotransferase [candidate division WS1 bacterium]
MSSVGVSKLAISGGSPAVTLEHQPWPIAGDLEARWMDEVVRSGPWSWVGPHERAFCEEFARFIGARHAMGLSNGTVTIQTALQAVGVRPGDEVIVPGLTWVATMQAALDIGASVVLVDIDPETWGIDPAAAEAAITERTRAIVPVHLYGCMVDMDAIMDLARRYDLKVVEDCAHQHGSRWRDRGAGSIGDAGSFSFQQSKILTSGEGGAITCNDDEVYRTAFALKHVGWAPTADGEGLEAGGVYAHNYRTTEMQCVLLRGGLTRIEEQSRIRGENVARLTEGLARIGGPLRVARRDPRITRQAYYAVTMHFDPAQADGVDRAHYVAALAAEGVGIGVPYYPVYRHPLMNLQHPTSPIPFRDPALTQDYANLSLPNVERTCGETGAVMSHKSLLSEPEYIDQLIEGVAKVNDRLEAVREHFAAQEATE